jgi:hypothetical protein
VPKASEGRAARDLVDQSAAVMEKRHPPEAVSLQIACEVLLKHTPITGNGVDSERQR